MHVKTTEWWLPDGKGGCEEDEGKGGCVYGDRRRLGFRW